MPTCCLHEVVTNSDGNLVRAKFFLVPVRYCREHVIGYRCHRTILAQYLGHSPLKSFLYLCTRRPLVRRMKKIQHLPRVYGFRNVNSSLSFSIVRYDATVSFSIRITSALLKYNHAIIRTEYRYRAFRATFGGNELPVLILLKGWPTLTALLSWSRGSGISGLS